MCIACMYFGEGTRVPVTGHDIHISAILIAQQEQEQDSDILNKTTYNSWLIYDTCALLLRFFTQTLLDL